jgi:hypothetical protein
MTEEQKKHIEAHFEQLALECMADFPITESDIAELKSKNPSPSGEAIPCFLACIFKKAGMVRNTIIMIVLIRC